MQHSKRCGWQKYKMRENVGDFIKAGAVGIGVSGALINKNWIDNGEYEKITELAKKFVESIR